MASDPESRDEIDAGAVRLTRRTPAESSRRVDAAAMPSATRRSRTTPRRSIEADDEVVEEADRRQTNGDAVAARRRRQAEEARPSRTKERASSDWYILKVQVNREESIRGALERRVKIAGLERFFGEIVVPTEDVAEYNKSGKRRIVKKKLYPGLSHDSSGAE